MQVLILTECNTGGWSWSRSLGAYQIASHLRGKGYTVQVIDFLGYFSGKELQRLIDRFVDEQTLAVCFSVSFFNPSLREIYDLEEGEDDYFAKLVRKRVALIRDESEVAGQVYIWPFDFDQLEDFKKCVLKKSSRVRFVLGGAQSRKIVDSSAAILQLEEYFDYFIEGYGEIAVEDLMHELSGTSEGGILPVVRYFQPGLDNYDFVSSSLEWEARDGIFSGEVLPIEISRGCIFRCKFCSFPLKGKTKMDYIKKPEVLYLELMQNYERFGITKYMFCDDTFNDSRYKLELLLEKVVSRLPFKIDFFAYLRLDLIARDLTQIDLLRRLGVRYAKFGIESIHDATIRFIGKGFGFQEIKGLLGRLRREWGNAVLLDGSFIFGLPKETRQSLEFMRQWLSEDGLDYFHSYSIYPLHLQRVYSRNEVAMERVSDLSINAERYGYKWDEKLHPGGWWRDDLQMGFQDMRRFVDEVSGSVESDERLRVGQHIGLALENLGVGFDEISTTPKNILINRADLVERYHERIISYKSGLNADFL